MRTAPPTSTTRASCRRPGPASPALNTPFPPYFGLSMVGRAGAPGDTLVQASSSTSLLATHAIRTAAGGAERGAGQQGPHQLDHGLLVLHRVPPGSSVSAAQWQKSATSISTFTPSSATSITVPPYSVSMLRFGAGGGGGTTGPLRNVAASRCLDVNGVNQTNGTLVIIWDCHGATNQQWTTTAASELRVFGGKRLDALNHATTPGSPVGIWDCGGTNQKWTLNPNSTITGQESRLCLAPANNATTNGTAVVLATRSTATIQP